MSTTPADEIRALFDPFDSGEPFGRYSSEKMLETAFATWACGTPDGHVRSEGFRSVPALPRAVLGGVPDLILRSDDDRTIAVVECKLRRALRRNVDFGSAVGQLSLYCAGMREHYGDAFAIEAWLVLDGFEDLAFGSDGTERAQRALCRNFNITVFGCDTWLERYKDADGRLWFWPDQVDEIFPPSWPVEPPEELA